MSAGNDQNQAAPQDARPLRRAWKMISHGEQFKATVVLLTMTVSMVTWKYFGSPEFYDQGLSRRLSLGGDPQVLAAVYCFLASFVLLGVIPALIVKFVFRERLADYGVQLGIPKRTFRSMAIFVPIFLVSGYTGSFDPAMQAYYPINPRAGASGAMFALHATTYFLFYLGWEFGFRGFMQIGLRGSMGEVSALLVQVLASVALHFGRPATETYLSILGGILWGVFAYRTRSLLSGTLQHYTLALSLDWFLCFRT